MGILNGNLRRRRSRFPVTKQVLFVTPFHTSHDARESCGYKIDCSDGRKISIATDLGEMTEEVFSAVSGSDLVMLESNHDVMMLENGPYPYSKKRILGKKRASFQRRVCKHRRKACKRRYPREFISAT